MTSFYLNRALKAREQWSPAGSNSVLVRDETENPENSQHRMVFRGIDIKRSRKMGILVLKRGRFLT